MKKAKKASAKKPAETYMSPDELRAALDKIGVSQEGFGRLINVQGRTVRSWLGEYPVPKVVALLLRTMIKHKLTAEDIA